MKPLTGFAPATKGCDCNLCMILRSQSEPDVWRPEQEFELAQADTLPPAETTKQQTTYFLERLQDELRRRGM